MLVIKNPDKWGPENRAVLFYFRHVTTKPVNEEAVLAYLKTTEPHATRLRKGQLSSEIILAVASLPCIHYNMDQNNFYEKYFEQT